jgi:hypothetical protein
MDRHRRLIFVPRADIVRLELAHSGAEQPIVVATLGLVCAALAVGSVVTLALHFLRGTVKLPAALITGVAFLIPAWWLLSLALKSAGTSASTPAAAPASSSSTKPPTPARSKPSSSAPPTLRPLRPRHHPPK